MIIRIFQLLVIPVFLGGGTNRKITEKKHLKKTAHPAGRRLVGDNPNGSTRCHRSSNSHGCHGDRREANPKDSWDSYDVHVYHAVYVAYCSLTCFWDLHGLHGIMVESIRGILNQFAEDNFILRLFVQVTVMGYFQRRSNVQSWPLAHSKSCFGVKRNPKFLQKMGYP